MNYQIREMEEHEYPLLNEFLYEAIFVPEGAEKPDKSIIKIPELSIYTMDFGKHPGDYCFVAEVANQVIGAVWARIINDYGHIDNQTPSLSISLFEEFRGFGIGKALMKQMLDCLQKNGYKQTSLSVQKKNYAVKMYLDLGFRIYEEKDEEYIMVFTMNDKK